MAQLAEIKTTLIGFDDLEEIIYLFKNITNYDLGGYSKSSLKRRVERFLTFEKMDLTDLKNAIVNTKNFESYFIQELVVNLTEMFRNPTFYQEINRKVLSTLKKTPNIKLWSAGAATGEEAYSLAILLKESDLLDRSFIYGTDINQNALEIAKKGIYPLKKIKSYTDNFNKTLISSDFSCHYTAMYDAAIINHEYRTKVQFSIHNLAMDHAFNEFQLILCRNVMIYFDKELQEHVLTLFYNSLSYLGFLCLGEKESLAHHSILDRFKIIDKKHNIYQKIK